MTIWKNFTDTELLENTVCDLITQSAEQAIADHGYFSLVLAGGTTPFNVYKKLAVTQQDWSHWQLYYGDERCLAVDDSERNSVMVEKSGLSRLVKKHYVMPSELGAEQGAQAYNAIVGEAKTFDMVLLGIGEDGHTASLFPGHTWPNDSAIPIHNSPKPPSDRISLSVSALQNTKDMIILAVGKGKADAVNAWKAGEQLPVAVVSNIPQAQVFYSL